MTTTPRSLLPLFVEGPHGSRSAMTCHYRCGDACAQPMPNTSDNEEFHQIAARAIARRSMLKGAGAAAGAMVIGGLAASPAAAHGRGRPGHGRPGHGHGRGGDLSRFSPVAPNNADDVTVPRGFRTDVLIRWGDPVEPGAPRFDVRRQTPEAARRQFGYNNDYTGVVPTGRDTALLVCNHEYTDEALMFPTGAYDSATIKRIAMASHGMSVVEIRRGRRKGSWEQVDPRRTRRNRRLHTGTAFAVDGPAAGTERLRTSADPRGRTVLGTLNNCSGGMTPWGTVLSGEENFNQYFDGTPDPTYAASYARYGITGTGTRGWSEVEDRFDLGTEPHEPFRFGWIVEVDPHDPRRAPVKHTMLGRFKHEGANVAIARDGRVVAYMGDDERGDYIYRFVSRDRAARGSSDRARRANRDIFAHGTLSVAKFTGDGTYDGQYDGTGEWIPLASDRESFVPGMSVADVLIDTRLAADRVGPTRMDRPEDIEPNPVNGRVYCALTNNSQRGSTFPVEEANPLASSMVRSELDAPLTSASGNRNGYVLEIDPRRDHTDDRFTWTLLLVCGDPEAPETYFAGYPKQLVSPISCPDNVAFDGEGTLWVSTDGNALGSNDGLFRVPVSGPQRGAVRQFLTVPIGAETCGPLIVEDRSVFVAVQHPGETDGATFEQPSSTWPHTDAFPRPAIAVTYRD